MPSVTHKNIPVQAYARDTLLCPLLAVLVSAERVGRLFAFCAGAVVVLGELGSAVFARVEVGVCVAALCCSPLL